MYIRNAGLLLVLHCFLSVSAAFSQTPVDWYKRGQQAYEEKRYNDAVEAYEFILKSDSENAEVQYLLARTLFEKGDVKSAERVIRRALRKNPENVSYLELQLSIGFPLELLEIVRRARRDELAVKLLLLDSLSVPANLQLGKGLMYEWLEWRERYTVEDLEKAEDGWLGETRPDLDNLSARSVDQLVRPIEDPDARKVIKTTIQPVDPFDLLQLSILNGNIQNLSPRAEDAYPKAEKYLHRALVKDPQLLDAYLNLARLYLTRPDMLALLDLARSMREHLPENYYTWMLGGYAQHYRGNEKEAEKQLLKAFEFMPDSIKVVYEDTGRLMNKEGLEKRGQAGSAEEKFWDFKDPRVLTAENERQNEHYARIVFADLLFSEPLLNLAGWDAERGQIYIRYGQPRLDFYLSNEVADCGLSTQDLFHVFQYPDSRFVFASRAPNLNDFAFYSPCSQVVTARKGIGANTDYVMQAEANIRETPEMYTYDAGGKRVEFPYQMSRFKGQDGNIDLYVPYGIPVKYSASQRTQKLTLQAGAFLLSEEAGLLDEDRSALTEVNMTDITRFQGAALWLDTHHLETQPGQYDVSIEFETGTGAGFYRDKVELADFGEDALTLSDLMLAYFVEEVAADDTRSTSGMVLRDGVLMRPAPWGVFSRLQPMYLYFEMYNLKKNAEGQTRYAVESVLVANQDEKGLEQVLKRAFRGRVKEGVSVRFENTGASSDEGQYLILESQDQPAGTYVLVMRVHDLIGETVVETRRMVLLE